MIKVCFCLSERNWIMFLPKRLRYSSGRIERRIYALTHLFYFKLVRKSMLGAFLSTNFQNLSLIFDGFLSNNNASFQSSKSWNVSSCWRKFILDDWKLHIKRIIHICWILSTGLLWLIEIFILHKLMLFNYRWTNFRKKTGLMASCF